MSSSRRQDGSKHVYPIAKKEEKRRKRPEPLQMDITMRDFFQATCTQQKVSGQTKRENSRIFKAVLKVKQSNKTHGGQI